MYIQNRFDCHVHSDCSPRGTDSVMGLCEQAIHRGLTGMAITDCCDCDRFDSMKFSERVRESIYCVHKARSVFGEDLVISSGVEVGQPLDNIEKADKVIGNDIFDIVLASVKKFPDGKKLSEINYPEITEREVIKALEEYYQLLIDTVKWGNFDVLSQILLPFRYIDRKDSKYFSSRYCDDQIELILKMLAENGKALEVNTAALRGRLNIILPPIRYLRMFRELGGEFVTVGSGAHSADTLGSDLSEGINLIYEAGFPKYCYYEKRKPIFLDLD